MLQYFSGSVIVPHEIDIFPKSMLQRSYSFTYSGNVEMQSVYKIAICHIQTTAKIFKHSIIAIPYVISPTKCCPRHPTTASSISQHKVDHCKRNNATSRIADKYAR